MKKIAPISISIILLFTGNDIFAQNIPADKYRAATPKEILLHDNPYNILQREIETNICDANWNITKKPFLLSDNRDEKIVIIDYLKGVGNIPVFMRKGESFEIKMNPESPLYKSNQDEVKKQTDAYVARIANISSADKKELAVIKTKNEQYEKNLNRLSDDKTYGSISLEINQSTMYVNNEGKGNTKALILPGIRQGILRIEYPDEASVDTTYRATLFIGNWPKFSDTKTPSFHFIKNSDPVIENIIIEISAFNYNKMTKMIHNIDWTKLEALIKK
jgi:hypothetical protein